VEGENSTSGPQPYQPYEAEVTNSPISNSYKIDYGGKFSQEYLVYEGQSEYVHILTI